MSKIPPNLFVLEMANNHMGDVEHGIDVIRAFAKVCSKYPFKFAFKLQYRDLDTFIHPDSKGRDDIKYVKRFSETRLSRRDFDRLVEEIRNTGFLTMSTPFDEPSVALIEDQRLDVIKIASCSFGDWPLLERVVATDKPIIASTAGASVDMIDRVVSFLSHRRKDFAILHCVGEYPTPVDKFHLSQIDYLKHRYPDVRIGFSTHEPSADTDIVKLAIAKGADLFEKHIGVPTSKYALNNYSTSPDQLDAWLAAAEYAMTVCGEGKTRLPPNDAETAGLRSLRRGVFARRAIPGGTVLKSGDVFFAFPPRDSQFTANDWSKYSRFVAREDIPANAPIGVDNTAHGDTRERVWNIVQRVKSLLADSRITFPGSVQLEISHHYGIDRFDEFGLTMLTVVNREYCKKLLVSLPGQCHPEQYHEKKEETFHVLYGEVHMELNGKLRILRPGDVLTIEPHVRHAFRSPTGAVVEEISSTHHTNDSYYTDGAIDRNPDRKTFLTHWMN